MAGRPADLLLPPLILLLLGTPAQVSCDYHYFGEKSGGDTWEELRLQHQEKGNQPHAGGVMVRKGAPLPRFASWLQTDPPPGTANLFPSAHWRGPLWLVTLL